MFTFLVFVTFLVQPPNANPGQKIQWDHDGVNTDHYEYFFDTPPYISTAMTKEVVIPALEPGLHGISVHACNGANCSNDAVLQFQIVAVLPSIPTNLRITPLPAIQKAKPTTKPWVK